ncbi:MAG: hypothetical protein Q8M09_20635 [Pseudomonadota bacterium]|nr:hypothetical protein [Pseudomonadota bacterium]MDP2351683.1 hypothetical protein [Pseudomonadota bacterium]
MFPEHHLAARIALSLAGVDRQRQDAILSELATRLDRAAALARRDEAINRAHRMVGHIRVLAGALHSYSVNVWPTVRHLPSPPPGETPLQTCFFLACQAADDAGAEIPGNRQVRRIVA